MSLSDYARRKAFDFARRVYAQSSPSSNLGSGSAIRALLLTPFSLIYAAVFQEIDVLRGMNLGNYENISETDMDLLAGNLLAERPRGSRATTTVKMYVTELTPFTLEVFPYFKTLTGLTFSPIRRTSFTVNDILEEDGELYVNIPVISGTYGPSSVAAAGEIEEFRNVPASVARVTNPFATEGGNERLSNAEFFSYIGEKFNDGTLAQVGGTRNYIVDNYPEVSEIRLAPSGDPLVKRDEVWTEDGVYPNLLRLGEPFAEHTDLGVLDFSDAFGRATGVSFDASMEGGRIAIDGDFEKFRTILKVIDSTTILISGYDIDGSSTAQLWSEGPKIKTLSDVYMYTPALNIQSIVIDKRFFVTGLGNAIIASENRIYYQIEEGFAYTTFPTSGKLVVLEGTDTEVVYTVTGIGGAVGFEYLIVAETVTSPITNGTPMSLYDMSQIEVGVDILDRPVIYVLQIDQLDPLSFEISTRMNQTSPGEYHDPGWYINNTDPAEVFSAKEVKNIILDTKEGLNAFKEINFPLANVTDSSSLFEGTVETVSGDNIITISASSDIQYTEGREVNVVKANHILTSASVTTEDVTAGAGTGIMTIDTLDVEYDTTLGYRDDARVLVYNSVASLLATYEPGEVLVYGDKVERVTGSFSGTADNVTVTFPQEGVDGAANLPVSPTTGSTYWVIVDGDAFPATGTQPYLAQYNGVDYDTLTVVSTVYVLGVTLESVILTVSGTTILEVLSADGLPAFADASGLVSDNLISINAPSEEGGFGIAPVRVTYATNTSFGDLQTTMDSGDVQLLTKDTLVRSFLPTLIDATVNYSGSATSEEVYNKFVDLIQTVAKEVDEGERMRLDISNIVAELDEDGFTDSIDVNFEVRVTSYLDDGSFEVKYINPSDETVQKLAFLATEAPGEDRITLQRVKSEVAVPGRGKLFLGDNNPNTQEVLPYEAVIQNDDLTMTFILRDGYTTTYAHSEWEGVLVSVRDYDPELEFTEGAIFVPANNRPYVRQLVVIRQ